MNILFLTLSRITDISSRGIYTDLIRKFVGDGHRVYLTVPFERHTGRKTEVFNSCGATILGVKTLNIQKTNVVEKGVGTLMLEWQYMKAIRKHFGNVHFDLILYTTPPITFNKVIRWVKQKYNAKSYLLLKDIFPQNAVDLGMFSKSSLMYKVFRKKEKTLYQLSDYIGCMSPANCRYVIRHNPDVSPAVVEVCPNSIEPKTFAPTDAHAVKERYGIPEDKVLSIYGGNLGKPQGVDFLIECVASNESRPNSYIVIVGSGTEYVKIKTWFDRAKPKNARLLGALPKADYDVLISSADVGLIFLDRRFTIPNFPSRLLSYLECKIPVMAATDVNTDIGTIAETNGFGLWAESGNLEAFDKKFDTLLNDAQVRADMGAKGYEYLLSNYTVAHTANIVMAHFEQ